MPSIQITVPNDKGSQKFTIGEIARMILETHESSPTVGAQIVITEILSQAEVGEPPGIKPDKEIILLASAGHPYKSAASATRAARTRADLQGIVWDIVSVDGGWAIRDISTYTNWFEYRADKDALTADEISYKVLVSTAAMTRLCRSTGYREWANPLGLGVPVMFGGEGTPLAKGQEDAPAQTLPPHYEPGPQTAPEIDVTQGDTREAERDAPRSDVTPPLAPVNAETTDIEAEYAQRVNDHRVKTGRRPTFKADNEWRKSKGLKRDTLRDLRQQHRTEEERKGGHPPRS
jgi:hypothetical protein